MAEPSTVPSPRSSFIVVSSADGVALPFVERSTSGDETLEMLRPPWQPDNEAHECYRCNRKFNNITRRKHHCRACGRIVCGDCSPDKLRLPTLGYHTAVRVCNSCLTKYPDFASSYAAHPIGDIVDRPLSPLSPMSPRSEPGDEEPSELSSNRMEMYSTLQVPSSNHQRQRTSSDNRGFFSSLFSSNKESVRPKPVHTKTLSGGGSVGTPSSPPSPPRKLLSSTEADDFIRVLTTEPQLETFLSLCDIAPAKSRDELVNSILYIFYITTSTQFPGVGGTPSAAAIARYLSAALNHDFASVVDLSTLLRNNTLITALLVACSKAYAHQYVSHLVLKCMREILRSPPNVELDPEKINSQAGETLEGNQGNLSDIVQRVFDVILGSLDSDVCADSLPAVHPAAPEDPTVFKTQSKQPASPRALPAAAGRPAVATSNSLLSLASTITSTANSMWRGITHVLQVASATSAIDERKGNDGVEPAATDSSSGVVNRGPSASIASSASISISDAGSIASGSSRSVPPSSASSQSSARTPSIIDHTLPSRQFCSICHVLASIAAERFPGSEASHSVMAGLVFLRLLCPPIMTFDLKSINFNSPDTVDASLSILAAAAASGSPPSSPRGSRPAAASSGDASFLSAAQQQDLARQYRRSLVMVCKVLQNTANDVLFGQKEVHFRCLNPLVEQNRSRVRSFLVRICELGQQALSQDAEYQRTIATSAPASSPVASNSKALSECNPRLLRSAQLLVNTLQELEPLIKQRKLQRKPTTSSTSTNSPPLSNFSPSTSPRSGGAPVLLRPTSSPFVVMSVGANRSAPSASISSASSSTSAAIVSVPSPTSSPRIKVESSEIEQLQAFPGVSALHRDSVANMVEQHIRRSLKRPVSAGNEVIADVKESDELASANGDASIATPTRLSESREESFSVETRHRSPSISDPMEVAPSGSVRARIMSFSHQRQYSSVSAQGTAAFFGYSTPPSTSVSSSSTVTSTAPTMRRALSMAQPPTSFTPFHARHSTVYSRQGYTPSIASNAGSVGSSSVSSSVSLRSVANSTSSVPPSRSRTAKSFAAPSQQPELCDESTVT